ncbi:HD domain-containing phosphohydrolase [Oleidesulfovibrio sp.]|uniref:response regulator n=1 Tax=Oleidesulfovibrio sp. TaxID=2909707 RepID=UPI003A8631C6
MLYDSGCVILVVDDTEANIDILVEALGDTYEVRVALDGPAALESVSGDKPDLILLDVMMPGMDGYEVCRQLKSSQDTRDIPVIFLTAMNEKKNEAKGLALGAVDYVGKPFSPELLKSRVNNQLELKKHRDHLEDLVAERTRELEKTQSVTICSLATLAETRDPETGGHILRTQRYARELAKQLQQIPAYSEQLDDETINILYASAPLHDIGKVGVRDDILLKAAALTDNEFEEMKKHTLLGRDALRSAVDQLGDNSFMRHALDIIYAHHEKWDGTGYPEGLSGEQIPVLGRIMAIADVYDALVSRRSYKPPFSHRAAVGIIADGKGTHFDPQMVDAFFTVASSFKDIAEEYADSEEERDILLSEDL